MVCGKVEKSWLVVEVAKPDGCWEVSEKRRIWSFKRRCVESYMLERSSSRLMPSHPTYSRQKTASAAYGLNSDRHG